MEVIYVKSARNALQIANNGFLYTRDREYKEITYWKCVDFNKYKCKGRLQTRNGEIINIIGNHNHEKRHSDIAAKNVLAAMKDKASTSTDTPQHIIGEISENLGLSVSCKLPKIKLLKRTIQRTRKQVNGSPANPNSLQELVIPDRYTKTRKGDDFLFFDSGPGPERIIVFATNKAIDLLSKSDHWYADGTFKTSPLLFGQIYTIHGIQNHEVIPAIYALLPNQLESTYDNLFAALIAKAPALNPSTIMTDFEVAAQNAFRSFFPNCIIRGCFFHFCQAIYRKIKGCNDIQQLYEDISNVDNALYIRQIAALAFVPEEDVLSSFQSLIQSDFFAQHEQTLLPLIDYFENTWLGRSIGGSTRRRPARFPIELWNCYYASLEGLPRTNNSIEG
ncbi:uncharacterized protein B4U80_09577, partial [Leptotrombidium deliense]